MWEFQEHGIRDAEPVAAAFAATFPGAERYADVGAGTGVFAAGLRRRGVSIVACERSLVGRLVARWQGINARAFDLEDDPPALLDGPIDVAYCFEVAEHLTPNLGDRLVRFLSGLLAPTIVFTAATPGQGGFGHINEQPHEYWIERFERAGYVHDGERSRLLSEEFAAGGVWASWLRANVMVFSRG